VIRAVILIALVALPHRALAQACCAGSSAVTPGRLALHEDALVGIDAHIAGAYGSFDPTGTFVTTPSGASETDFEEDAFAAIRLFERGQAALLVPLVETRRTANGDSEFGGGIGDINLSARYDFVYAGEARYVPGIGLLVGITFPTGTPPESATKPLATDATGVGAYQANLGLSFEKTIGPWLFGLSGIVAKRTTRTAEGVTEALASQWTVLAAAAYTFPSETAIALSASFTAEGNASVDDMEQADTRRRLVAISASGLFPISDHLRLQGALTVDPPVGSFGINQPSAGIGGTVTAIYAWL
jgi:hypothetical protein